MGIKNRGNNYKTIHKYIKKYNIDTSHFNSNAIKINKLHRFNKIPTEKILVENSTYVSTSTLKNRLYKEGLKIRICELCGQNEEWHDNHMSLILDHINGIPTDNRIENLRIVCPNCNATLSTHGGKNVKHTIKYNYCNCGEIIGKNSKLCSNCEKYTRRKVERPPLEILLNDVKISSYRQVGKKYGVCDNTIRKWIKSYGVNLPKKVYKNKS